VMGDMKLGRLGTVAGWTVAAVIIGLNVFLLYETFFGGGASAAPAAGSGGV
jgi:Mn2+/Fe2+ NRAMP family transporter